MNIDEYRALKAQEDVQNSTNEEQTHVQTSETPTAQGEPIQETPTQSEPTHDAGGTKEETQAEPITFEVDGETLSADEIKNGYLRNRDYTQKTQELAKQRREVEHLLQLKTQLEANPELANQLAQNLNIPSLNPVVQRQMMMEQELADLKLERDIMTLQAKYEDFDVKTVLETAYTKNIENLEDAYLMSKATAQPTPPAVNVEELKASLREELLTELKAQTQPPVDTGTIITTNGGSAPVRDTSPTLSDAELSIATKMGLSPEEYAKWRD